MAHKWWGAYVTRGGWGFPNTAQEKKKLKSFHKWVWWLRDPYRVRSLAGRGTKSEGVHNWAEWLHNPCSLVVLKCFKRGTTTKSGPQVGLVASKPAE